MQEANQIKKASIVERIVRVMAFCLMPKSEEVLRRANAWVIYTGDGLKLPDTLRALYGKLFMYQKGTYGDLRWASSPPIFITGPDNPMLAECKQMDAEDFSS